MNLKEGLGVAPANELRHVGSRTKGTMGQTEMDEYEEVTPEGKVIARYTVTEHTNLRGLYPSKSRLSLKRSENRTMEGKWREFNEGEEWFAGRALWLWAPSWKNPRLATADRGDDFEWFYASGPKPEEASWEFPTHCCAPTPPTPPAV